MALIAVSENLYHGQTEEREREARRPLLILAKKTWREGIHLLLNRILRHAVFQGTRRAALHDGCGTDARYNALPVMVATFLTIGHSNRGLDEMIDMLREAQVSLLIDIRSFPRSRANPQFNIESLPGALAKVQIGYRHCPALGGRRPGQPAIDENLNALWRVQSFHNYADYALSDAFGAALSEIIEIGRVQRLALMCSEAVWWRCHRRIIADYLLLSGLDVDHLMSPGHRERAKPTPGAVATFDGKVIYPAGSSTGM